MISFAESELIHSYKISNYYSVKQRHGQPIGEAGFGVLMAMPLKSVVF
jgi:hypothetical protein